MEEANERKRVAEDLWANPSAGPSKCGASQGPASEGPASEGPSSWPPTQQKWRQDGCGSGGEGHGL